SLPPSGSQQVAHISHFNKKTHKPSVGAIRSCLSPRSRSSPSCIRVSAVGEVAVPVSVAEAQPILLSFCSFF
ncbi:hypothetical protein Csa_020081, partial [Cucumis sativus]